MQFDGLTLDQINANLCANSFIDFVQMFWPIVSTDTYVHGYHIDAICEHLQAMAEGKIKKLLCNVAVRHSKSLLFDVFYPAWSWVREPDRRFITATYSKSLSDRDALRSRRLIESPQFQRLFSGQFKLSGMDRVDWYETNKGGYRLSVSTGASTQGKDADTIIADDLMDFATRKSEAERTAALDYWNTVLSGRLVLTGREQLILCGHRVHEEDVFGDVRKTYGDDGSWTYLVLAEEHRPCTWFNGLGWKDKRAEGELLWPKRYDPPALDTERKRYRHDYHLIFQQDPTPREGNLFSPKWFQYYEDCGDTYKLNGKHFRKDACWRIATSDLAVGEKLTNDYTVVQIWDVLGPHIILVDQIRRHLNGVQLVPALMAMYQTYQPAFIAVEQVAMQNIVIDELRAAGVMMKPMPRTKDKEARSVSAQIKMQAKQVWLPQDQPNTADFQNELLAFPLGRHDDMVDCLSDACALSAMGTYGPAADPMLEPEDQKKREQADVETHFKNLLMADLPILR